MNNTIKTIATATLAAATVIGTSAKAVNVDPAHYELGKAIVATGVEFKINPAECFSQKALGWYWSSKNELVICQENAYRPGTEVRWTAEDFDTLRHEAQHLIQDCVDGSQNGELQSVYTEPVRLGKSVLGNAGIQQVAKAYRDQSEHVIVLEIEAFAVAALNDPLEQVNDIKTYCF